MNLDPRLSTQATIVAVVYSIFAAFNLVYAFVPPFSWGRVFSFLIWVGFAIITIYDTNCLAQGCATWCWIRTILYCLIPIVIVMAVLIRSFSNTEGDDKGQVCILSA